MAAMARVKMPPGPAPLAAARSLPTMPSTCSGFSPTTRAPSASMASRSALVSGPPKKVSPMPVSPASVPSSRVTNSRVASPTVVRRRGDCQPACAAPGSSRVLRACHLFLKKAIKRGSVTPAKAGSRILTAQQSLDSDLRRNDDLMFVWTTQACNVSPCSGLFRPSPDNRDACTARSCRHSSRAVPPRPDASAGPGSCTCRRRSDRRR